MRSVPDYKKELENFSYSVSHDLSAPFRHIKAFSNILLEDLADKMTEGEKEYFQYITNNVQVAESMLAALLTYSRLNTDTSAFENVDCNKLVSNMLLGFEHEIKEKNVQIEVENLPTSLKAKRRQSRTLFFNIIDNAIKFLDEDRRLKININAEDKDDYWLFSVKDNGIGIAENQIENVFKMFKQTNPKKYDGIGCGLTTAQKIAWNHHGSIWLESELGKGTTVFVSIPKSQPE